VPRTDVAEAIQDTLLRENPISGDEILNQFGLCRPGCLW
jgi:hypothetical protein